MITGSAILLARGTDLQQIRRGIWTLWAGALLSAMSLVGLCGKAVLPLSLAGFVLGHGYTAPPVELAYIGRGLGELDLVLCFGPLPALGSYYTQSRELSWPPVIASLPLGLLTSLILFNNHFLHWRSDLAAGKISPVVALGEEHGLQASAVIGFASIISLCTAAATKTLPPTSLIALGLVPAQIRALRNAKAQRSHEAYLKLMMTSLQESMGTGTILASSILLSEVLKRRAQHGCRA